MPLLDFYKGRSVLVTGHTGFKGSWLCAILNMAGAKVTGYALKPPTQPSLFELAGLAGRMTSLEGDIRDYASLQAAFEKTQPEVVIHLAAQPLVRESYRDPRGTYDTNVMGTVNVLECVRNSPGVKSLLNVTTDKVYLNREWEWGYREEDVLGGYDPYSNSKSCSEMVTQCYRQSFFGDSRIALSTARAGNVIGGGDFAADRIIPDCVQAALDKRDIIVRNPHSTRPYQHVLEPLFAYLLIAARQHEDSKLSGSYNVGPDEEGCCQTGRLASAFCAAWGQGIKWLDKSDGGPHEASFLKLDCSRIKNALGWRPVWTLEQAVEKTVAWTKCWHAGGDISACMQQQISEYLAARETNKHGV